MTELEQVRELIRLLKGLSTGQLLEVDKIADAAVMIHEEEKFKKIRRKYRRTMD